jgi:hydroxypyruvate reductase
MLCIKIKANIIAAEKMMRSFEKIFQKYPQGELLAKIFASTFQAIDPSTIVKKYLHRERPAGLFHNAKELLKPAGRLNRIFAFGLGKAAIAMTQSLADEISLTDSLVITKHASSSDMKTGSVILGNHPIPASGSLNAGIQAKKFLSQLTKDDLLICLISGGGSALMTSPVIPLEDLQNLTSALLKSGATIQEINTLRKHLDELKGGGLVQFANGAQILSLILSDVVGDSLEIIASGVTVPDSTTIQDALAILEKYSLRGQVPDSIFSSLKETLKADNPLFEGVINQVIGSNNLALQFACSQIGGLWGKEKVKIISKSIQGEASEVGLEITKQFKDSLQTMPRPFCLMAGGETTVTVKGNGKGGRNQELALSTVEELSGLKDIMLISIATDGEDGPTDAAGAVVTGETYQRSKKLGMDITSYKSRNDAYHFFESLGDLIKTNPTGTNVNDLVFCFAF